jgi:hypothetical protein
MNIFTELDKHNIKLKVENNTFSFIINDKIVKIEQKDLETLLFNTLLNQINLLATIQK